MMLLSSRVICHVEPPSILCAIHVSRLLEGQSFCMWLLRLRFLWQAEHLQVLLEAPGIRPTAICLIRHGDVDWLSFKQLHRTLLRNMGFTTLQSRLRNPKVVGM